MHHAAAGSRGHLLQWPVNPPNGRHVPTNGSNSPYKLTGIFYLPFIIHKRSQCAPATSTFVMWCFPLALQAPNNEETIGHKHANWAHNQQSVMVYSATESQRTNWTIEWLRLIFLPPRWKHRKSPTAYSLLLILSSLKDESLCWAGGCFSRDSHPSKYSLSWCYLTPLIETSTYHNARPPPLYQLMHWKMPKF
jgi:hypothetical protein